MAYLPVSWTLRDAVVPVAIAASAAEASHSAADRPKPASAPAPEAPAQPAAPSSAPPPPPVSEEERQLLQDLRGRRQEWEAKERVLAQREGILTAAEQRLVTRANELTALQTRLEQLEKLRADRDDANWVGLVKVYETMKPRDAASIFNDMDMPVLLQIVDRMKEVKAAVIFGAMQPDRARLLTSQLAAKRSRTTSMPDTGASPTADAGPHS